MVTMKQHFDLLTSILLLIFCTETSKAFTTISTTTSTGYYLVQQKRVQIRTFLARYRPNSNKPPPPPRKNNGGGGGGGGGESTNSNNNNKSERNWIEKSSPTGTNEDIEEYTLKLHGQTFQVGPLSLRIYDALMDNARKRFGGGDEKIPSDLIPIYKAYAMDMTCREATKAALKHNGLQMVEDDATKQSGMPGLWGEVENLEIVSSTSPPSLLFQEGDTNNIPEDDIVATAESIQEAVSQAKWVPGQPFNFIVRNVKAKLPELSLKDLIKTLNMEDMAKEMGMDDVDVEIGGDDDDIYDDDDDDDDYEEEGVEVGRSDRPTISYTPKEVNSLSDLRQDLENRCNSVPTRAVAIGFAGGGSGQGYDIVPVENLMNDSIKVCNSCKSHGFVVLDLGSRTPEEEALAGMWNVVDQFFTTLDREKEQVLPKMEVAVGAGSKNAVVGYASYENNAMQFLETRLLRTDNGEEKIIPEEFATLIGTDGVECIKRAQHILLNVGRDVARIAVACSLKEKSNDDNEEKELAPVITGVTIADSTSSSSMNNERFLDSSTTIIDSLMDHGQTLLGRTDISMSPHRLCRYADNGKNTTASATEVFGAHTDTSFVTIVPVAAVSGLEIFDNAAGAWVRPELMARLHWENEQMEQKKDPSSLVGSNGKPWHARYVVCMSGELLELVTQNSFMTAVHRVVAACGGEPRTSAPVLVRARPQALMDVTKFYGSKNPEDIGSLLASCDQLTMEEIHDSLQPSAA